MHNDDWYCSNHRSPFMSSRTWGTAFPL